MADTSWNLGTQYDGASGTDANASAVNAGAMMLLTNKSGGDLVTGDVVVLDVSNASAVVATTTAGDLRSVFVVPQNVTGSNTAANKTIANNEAGWFWCAGAYVPAAGVSAAVSIGEYLKTSSTAKKLVGTGVVQGASTTVPIGACAVALAAAGGAGYIPVMLLGRIEAFGITDKTEKTAIADDDIFIIADSEASNALKKVKAKNVRGASYCYATNSGAITAAAGTMTAMTFDTEVADTDSYHSTSTNQSRFVAPVAGGYLVYGGGNANGRAYFDIFVDGSAMVPSVKTDNSSSGDMYEGITTFVYLTASQYVELKVAGNGGDRSVSSLKFAIVLLTGGA